MKLALWRFSVVATVAATCVFVGCNGSIDVQQFGDGSNGGDTDPGDALSGDTESGDASLGDASRTDTDAVDTSPPVITAYEVVDVAETSFRVNWYLNEPSTG